MNSIKIKNAFRFLLSLQYGPSTNILVALILTYLGMMMLDDNMTWFGLIHYSAFSAM